MPNLKCIQTSAPLVSVVVCVFNAGEYLRPSIESLLAQTYENLEILIVDDGSTDGCIESIKCLADPRMRILRQENRGKPAAINLALDQVGGEFYALHDADDLSASSRIERQLEALISNPDLACVFCGNDLILGNRHMAPLFRTKDRTLCRRDIERFRMPGHDPTAMYRMSLVRGIEYATDLPIVEGFDYILRVGERFPMMVVGECLYSYRIHPASVTKRNPELRDRLVREVLRRACERRGLDFDKSFPKQSRRAGSGHRSCDNNLAAHFMESVCDLRRMGKFRKSIRAGLECMQLHPFDLHYHKALFYAIAPSWIIDKVRRNALFP
jgi:glycosyltransferase involved in cell wall biosynthesis